MEGLKIPDKFNLYKNSSFSVIEGLSVSLRRLALHNSYTDSKHVLSIVFTLGITYFWNVLLNFFGLNGSFDELF